MMFEPNAWRLLEAKGTISSLLRPGRDLGSDYQAELHYIFPFDDSDAVRRLNERVWVHSHAKGRFYPWTALRGIIRAVRLVRERKIDMVITVDPYVGGLMAAVVAWLTGRPLVVEVMGEYDVIYRETGRMINPSLIFRRLENCICNRVMRAAAMVIGYMEPYRQFAINHGALPAKTYTAYFSAQEYHFAPVSERGKAVGNYKRTASDRLVAYVGRVDVRKYADQLLEVYERVVKARADVVCLHIGDGPDRAMIEEEIRRRGLEGRVVVTGFLPNDEVWKIYAEVDVFAAVLAGSSLLEAGTAERAIVAYDTDWHGEFVKHGETGLLVPFKDVEGFAAAILRLLDDPAQRARLGRAARTLGMDRHSPETIIRTHRFLYEKALNRKDHCQGTGMVGRFS